MRHGFIHLVAPVLGLLVFAIASPAFAQDNYESWEILRNPFPSTGGGGVMIGEYDPVVVGDKCQTDFTAIMPDGTVYRNKVEFTARPAQGGILCADGKWRAADGSASGTTPLRVFIRDGVVRRSSH